MPTLTLPAAAADRGPLSPWNGARWDDGGLAVERLAPPRPAVGGEVALTEEPGRLVLRHRLPPSRIDNGLVAWLVGGLLRERPIEGDDVLGRLVVGLVRSLHPDALAAWSLFYGNSLARLAVPTDQGGDDLDVFGRIYRRASRALVGHRVLDVGSCLGFLPLLLTGRGGLQVTASDRDPGACHLLAAVAAHLDLPLRVVPADAAALPVRDAGVDTVTALHLLEHVDAVTGEAIVEELCRVAARRVIIAVPYEPVPDPRFGHVRCFDDDVLATIGAARRGWRWQVARGDGGWLVLDRR